jgi:hypothetical protein
MKNIFSNYQTKIFKNNIINQPKIINLRTKLGEIGNTKYLPSFSKEWRNVIYSFNKNNLKNIPINDINVNNIIKSYFNLFFKDHKYIGHSKFVLLKRRRKFLKRIFVSDAEIKHTNNKAKITLYTVNREKKILKQKYLRLSKVIYKELCKCYINNKDHYRYSIFKILIKKYKNKKELIRTKNYWNSQFQFLQEYIGLDHIFFKQMWTVMIKNQSKKYIRFIRKYNLLYSLNQFKFNKLILLPKLSSIIHKILGKKLEYNIINLKSISYNTDIFTNILALRIKKIKSGHVKRMFGVLNRAHLPLINTIQERTKIQTQDNFDPFKNKYRDLKIVSNIKDEFSILNLFNKVFSTNNSKVNTKRKNRGIQFTQTKDIHNTIYNQIKYKNMGGIRLEVKGRLTKRYRADRSIYSLKWKGGLKNIDSSFKGLSSVLFRGNTKSNTSYSIFTSKRRIGAFAVKGWIGGK